MLFSKFHSHPNLPIILKIHRKKIDDKNSLFAVKHSIMCGIKLKSGGEVVRKI